MVLCNEVTKWMKDDITQPPVEGVYVYGLYLEGAGWDRRNCKLIDSKPKVLFEIMPVIRMYAENNGLYFCVKKLFVLMFRTALIFRINNQYKKSVLICVIGDQYCYVQ